MKRFYKVSEGQAINLERVTSFSVLNNELLFYVSNGYETTRFIKKFSTDEEANAEFERLIGE